MVSSPGYGPACAGRLISLPVMKYSSEYQTGANSETLPIPENQQTSNDDD
jgi:hypothetical protein